MRLLSLCTFYHRALLFRQQMDAIQKRGHYVRAFNSAQKGEGIAEKFVPIMDSEVVHCECWNEMDRLFFFPRQWKIEKKLVESYNLEDFDLLHAHLMLSSGYTALRMKKRYGLKYVVSVRTTDLTGFIRFPYFKKMAVEILREASGIMFLSNSMKEQLASYFHSDKVSAWIENKSMIVPNCLEPYWAENTQKAKQRNFSDGEVRIIAVAKIRPVKNLSVAAQAVDELCKRGYHAVLTIVGENQNEEEYRKLMEYTHVKLLPFMKSTELCQEYNKNDIFLLPSINETFGRVYVEAMSQGLPVLYTQNQGFDRTFPEGTVGYSVPSNAPSVIADRIEDIMHNYNQISERCIEKSKLFHESNVIDALENFYLAAVNRKEK